MTRTVVTIPQASGDRVELADLVDTLRVDEQFNILLIGPTARTREALRIITPHLRQQVARWSPRTCDEIPDLINGTLVIDDIHACRPWQQLGLQAWIESARGARVVSIASTPLFPRVGAGFLAALYYRLNVIVLDESDAGGS